MKILFFHGWHSVVGGVKPTFLKAAGHQVINPYLDDDDFDRALQTAQDEFDRHAPDVVVGSSRGGAVAMNIKSGNTPLVLLCPAWKNWGGVHLLKRNALILHSREDDVIPFEHSEQLIVQSGLPPEMLIEVGNDHRLADEASLAVMLWACILLATGQQIPALENSPLGESDSPLDAQSDSQEEGCYICDACGETIVVPLDLTEGSSQTYVEDCPVCCRANTIHVQLDVDGVVTVWAEPEQEAF
ncbi:MAG: CPXCG motif-containing cysteine-rich protein [Pirellulales bacterium]